MGLEAGTLALIASSVASIGSVGVSAASAAGAFDKKTGFDPPQRTDPSILAARRDRLRAARNATGRQSTRLTPLGQSEQPATQSATLLGGGT
jgi:hypothetical protein